MPFQRTKLATEISARLHVLANQLKTLSRAGLTNANHSLEHVMARFFNALFGWKLINLNDEQPNFPAADLGDRSLHLAMQITNEEAPSKISETAETAMNHAATHGFGTDFTELIIFFLIPRKPKPPKTFTQPANLKITTWDLKDLLEKMHALENIAALEEALRILKEELGERNSPDPLPNLHQLPPNPRLSGFVGREKDLEILRQQPTTGTVLTGLRGMGGIGKTALGLVLAYEWSAQFPDAQFWLDGHGTHAVPTTPESLLAKVIQTYHPTAQLPAELPALQEHYRQILSGKRALIVLDNARDAAQAQPLIPPAGCGFIVTSRNSIDLPGGSILKVGTLDDDEAIKLLRSRYTKLTDDEAASLTKLCGNLPLALRIAESHIYLESIDCQGSANVTAYVKALKSNRLPSLDEDATYTAFETISNTLRLSEAQLPPAEQTAWRNLSVFASSFDAFAAKEIAGADETILSHLVRRSLLDRDGTDRYKLHDLAAEYAQGKLAPTVLDALRMSHAKHFAAVGAETNTLYKAGNPIAGMALFDRERDQIEAAYTWLNALEGRPAARQMITLVDSIAHTSNLRFHPRQRINWLESQLRAASAAKRPLAEAAALGNLGLAYADLGDASKSIAYHEKHLAMARELGSRRGQTIALGNLGLINAKLGDPQKAIEYGKQAFQIAREFGDPHGACNALCVLGIAHRQLADWEIAMECYQQYLLIANKLGDLQGECAALCNMANIVADLGQPEKASRFCEQALKIAIELGDRRGEATALWNSGLAYKTLGNLPEAIARARAALAIFEAFEDPHASDVRARLARWTQA